MRFWLLLMSLLLAIPAPAATKYKVLYNFKGGNDALGPLYGALALDKDGNLFGTAGGGGQNSKCGGTCGTVFELTPEANGKWSESVVFRFQPTGTGFWPFGGVIVDQSGNLYGTNVSGGTHNEGTVYALTPGSRGWSESILYSFGSHKNDAAGPFSGLVAGPAGHFYAAAYYPYELSREAGGGWTERVLYRFRPKAHKDDTDGWSSDLPLIRDSAGHLYGVTTYGGNYSKCAVDQLGCGTVFELVPGSNGKWEENILYRFAEFNNDGEQPLAGVVMDSYGHLYGTTSYGGKYQNGTIYELIRDKAGHWQEKILYSFRGNGDGGLPVAPVIVGGRGNLYGTAGGGGGACSCGVIFKLAPVANGKWKYTVLHHFHGADGGQPWAGLSFGRKGEIYGTTSWGGKYLYGVVFEITR